MTNTPTQHEIRTAQQCIEREDELNGTKGRFCIIIAKKIINNTVSAKELKEFNSYRDFISMSFM